SKGVKSSDIRNLGPAPGPSNPHRSTERPAWRWGRAPLLLRIGEHFDSLLSVLLHRVEILVDRLSAWPFLGNNFFHQRWRKIMLFSKVVDLVLLLGHLIAIRLAPFVVIV